MAKVTLTDLTSLANDTSAVNSLNTNFQTLEDYINNNVLSRDTGVETNTMQNDIDMNSYGLLNIANINSLSVSELEANLTAQVTYAEEWAQKAEDSLVSVAAGGNGTTEYSAFHYSEKASASATAAASSASSASTAQTAAEAAQTAAETAYDSFDDRYLGSKASAPTLDNDGNALLTGALYWDTVAESMYVYTGSVWNAAAFDTSGALVAANNLSELTNTATARSNLGLVIGTDVQAYDADTAKLDVQQTFTAGQTGSTQTASVSGSTTLDFATYNNFVLTMTGNVTLANPSTEVVGQSGFITFIHDGSGPYTVTLGTDYETAGGAGLTLSGAASTTDIVAYCVIASGRILLGTPALAFS